MKIKSILALILTGVILLAGCQVDKVETSSTVSNAEVSGEELSLAFDLAVDLTNVKRGVNLSSLEDPRKYSKFLFEEDTYTNIAGKGFDHVRLPVDFRNYADKDGNLDDKKMQDVDSIIKSANEAGLVVFLDFHGWYDLNTIKGDDILFMKIWKGLAERYKDYEHNDMLIFELINEPHTTEGGNLDMSTLSMLEGLTANAIRKTSPNRTICFAVADWNGSWILKADTYNSYRKSVLMDYENVIVAIHTYATLEFTHQNMAWNGTQGQFVKLDETVFTELRKQLRDMMNFTAETGVPVILNEFGLNTDPNTIPYEDQASYVQYVMDILGEQDVPWTWWAYNNGEFAIYKKASMFGSYEWNEAVLKVMMAD